MFNKPNQKQDFFRLEEEILKYWKENNTFEKSISNRKDAEDYIFYDGPPFMSGMPHYATLLSSLPKDVIPRYQTMKGKKVERVWGWDTHGLPIENKVEKELGLKGPKDIDKIGLDTFIQKCYEWNRVGIDNWRWYIDHIGRWADIDNAYRTLDQEFMESTWWTFKQIWDKGLIYKGKRVSLFSTDSSTPVSNFEVSMDPDNYQDTEDIAVTVKFKLTEESRIKVSQNINNNPTFLLAWTTTPWTLSSNFALAVNPSSDYLVINIDNNNYIINEKRLSETLMNTKYEYSLVNKLTPSDLEGLMYEQLYNFLPGKEKDFKVYLSNYVTTEDGTGILHVAPAFGEADFNMGNEFGLSDLSNIDDEGIIQVGPWKGMYLRDANSKITLDLIESGKLFKKESYKHRLPYYRYKNPLIYKAQTNYFINVQKIKDQLIKSNENINWIPEHFKNGRFKNVLETAPDWSISRSRYWGTSMPVWRSEDGQEIVVGSRDELMQLVNESKSDLKIRKIVLVLNEQDKESLDKINKKIEDLIKSSNDLLELATTQENLSHLRNKFFGETEQESKVKPIKNSEHRAYYLINEKSLDLHRPYIDKIYFIKDNIKFVRIPETMDVWMDSGSMPFAQFHYPFINKEKFEKSFPGDFIAEYTGQIRAWFYVLHVISNSIFHKEAFKNVLVTGVLAGTDGRKMSKSYGNYPDPKDTIIKYGGEALRLYFLGSTLMAGNDMDFNEKELRLQTQEFILPLWNIYSYLITYSNIHEWKPSDQLAYNSRRVFKDNHPWDHIPFDDLEEELDSWIILRLQKTILEVTLSLDSYEIPKALKLAKELIDDISKWYIRSSRERFATGEMIALDVLYYVFIETIKLLAPFIPFITEYMYQEIVAKTLNDVKESVHLSDYPIEDKVFIEQYSMVEEEMKILRRVCEMGHMLRTQKQLKVRQPLASLEISSTNSTISILSEWMKELIQNEVNVKEAVDKINIEESSNMIVLEDKSLGIKIGLNIEINNSLREEGLIREITRFIQALRKKQGMQQGDMINITFDIKDGLLKNLLQNSTSIISETVGASKIMFNEIPGESEVLNLEGKDLKIAINL